MVSCLSEEVRMKRENKVLVGSIFVISVITLFYTIYLFIIPFLVTKTPFVNYICKKLPFELTIESPVLKTKFNSEIILGAKKIELKQNQDILLDVEDLKTSFYLAPIVNKKIVLNHFSLNYVFADFNGLLKLVPSEPKEDNKPSNFSIDWYDSILDIKNVKFLYAINDDTNLEFLANNLYVDNTQKLERLVHFNIITKLNKSNKILKFEIADNNKVVIKNKHLYINDCIFEVNKSKVHINAVGSNKIGLNLTLAANAFAIEDVTDIIATNLIIANGSEVLSYFKDLKGNFDFNINLKKSSIDGFIKLNNASLKLCPLADLPLKVQKGFVKINSKTIELIDFEAFYGNNASNKITLTGNLNDFMKSCDTELAVRTFANNEFAKQYLSKVVGMPLEIIGKADMKIVVKSIYNKLDIIVGAKLATGNDILVDGASLTPTTYDRAIKADLHIVNNILDIENINYYIAKEIVKGSKIKPILSLSGKIDISKPIPFVQEMGFDIPKPLPSEFLNVLIGQKLFKGGVFNGKLYMINNGHPILDGTIAAENIRIPSQRIFLKQGKLYTDKNTVHLTADARYRRSDLTFVGDIKNSFEFPIVIKKVDFSLDKLNVEKLLNSLSQQPQTAVVERSEDDESVTFDFNNLIIENCVFRLKEGSYKDINFGNLNANLTLDDKNVLNLHSNKFDIAEGISTIKVVCDLNKHKYYLRLGVKDVNSDLISTTILNLPKEIIGKARGLIELNTDDSFKLNGQIKFDVNNGQIPKIGLVEYLMKFVSVFRNPVVMISPTILSDMISIPDGSFDKISGELYLKDNIINWMKIESISPQLASLIVGKYNIENSDASLRIYTKFSNKQKGFGSALRKISLNSLANKISMNSKTNSNYYAAELNMLPKIEADDKDCQVFLTTVNGDIEHNNFISALKKIK